MSRGVLIPFNSGLRFGRHAMSEAKEIAAVLIPFNSGLRFGPAEWIEWAIANGVLIPFNSGLRFGRQAARHCGVVPSLNPLQFGSKVRSDTRGYVEKEYEGLNPLQFGSKVRSSP